MSQPKYDDSKALDPENSQKETFAEVAGQISLVKKCEMNSNIEYVPPQRKYAPTSTPAGQAGQRSRSSYTHDLRLTSRTQSSSPLRTRSHSTQMTANQMQKIILPPVPDFNSPPYTSSKGRAFGDPQYDKRVDRMEDRVNDLYCICLLIGGIVTADPKDLEDASLYDNILALGEGVEEVRLSSYKIAWRLLIGNWKFEELVRDELLIDTIKRNVRGCQQVTRLDVCCEMMLALGFTDQFLYK